MHSNTSIVYDSDLCGATMHTVYIVYHLQRCPGAGCQQGPALLRQRGWTQQQSRREAGCLPALLPQPEPETAAAAEHLGLLLLLLLQQTLEQVHVHKSSQGYQSEEARKKRKGQCDLCGLAACIYEAVCRRSATTDQETIIKRACLEILFGKGNVLCAERQRYCDVCACRTCNEC